MTDKVQDVMLPWLKYVSGLLLTLAMGFGWRQLDTILSYQQRSAELQTQILVKMAHLEESASMGAAAGLRVQTQVEELRTELVDVRMRVNTLEAKVK